MELTGISSMATKMILNEIAALYEKQTGCRVVIESVGGVDAARRVRAGETFDFVALAREALEALQHEGLLAQGAVVPFALSPVALAARHGAPKPNITDEAAVRHAMEHAASIGYSTGPSGAHLMKLIETWRLGDALAPRLVKAPAGVPVARLVAEGKAEFGFQQLSELSNTPGVDVIGLLPQAIQSVTVFAAGAGAHARDGRSSAAFLAFLASPQTAPIKQHYGMEPA
ncbi:MAG: substrate-binding domain-containing protein [Hyphomicrobiales bacterium]|nr:substrate-binding domain-containing protein [Hyphomicrobiales bacterium]